MIDNAPNIFDRELDFLAREVSSSLITSSVRASELNSRIGSLLEEYRKRDFDNFIEVSLPINGQKFSDVDLKAGPERVGRYLSFLGTEIDQVGDFTTGVFNQIQFQQDYLSEVSSQVMDKIRALRLYSELSNSSIVFDANPDLYSNETSTPSTSRLTISNGHGLVLPIVSSGSVTVESVTVNPESTGELGDPYNLDKEFNRDSLTAISDASPLSYFEYSRVAHHDVRLSLTFKLSSVSIVNCLVLDMIKYSFVSNVIIESVQYQLDNGQWETQAENLVPPPENGAIYLNPVKTGAIRLVLSSTGSEPIRIGSSRFTNRALIGIREISLLSVAYESKGEAITLPLADSPSGKTSLASVKFQPTNSNLFTTSVSLKDEQGEWQNITLRGSRENDFVNTGAGLLTARLNVELKANAFSAPGSVSESDFSVPLTRGFSPQRENPNRYDLEETFNVDSVRAVQGNGLNVGLSPTTVRGTRGSTTGQVSFPVPGINVENSSEVSIYVNGRVTDDYYVGTSTQGETLFTLNDVDMNALLSYEIGPEPLFFRRLGRHYVAKTRQHLVPLKEATKVEFLPSSESQLQLQYLRPGLDVYELQGDLISGFTLQSNGTGVLLPASYTLTIGTPENPRLGMAGAGEYYVDTVNGMLYFYEALSEELVAQYKSESIQRLQKYSFLPSSGDGMNHIRIEDSLASIRSTTEVIGDDRVSRLDFNANGTPYRFPSQVSNLNGTTVFLSERSIVEGSIKISEGFFGTSVPEEVPFIDGVTEFQSGVYVTIDLNHAAATVDGEEWSFNIPSDLSLDPSLGFFPSNPAVFIAQHATEPAAPATGDWWVDGTTLKVVVNTGTFLSELNEDRLGMFLTRSTRSTVRYSTEHRYGRVYCEQAPEVGSKVSYDVLPYRIGYRSAQPLETSLSGSTVEVPRGSMIAGSREEVYVYFETPVEKTNIQELQSYYSPVIETVSFDIVS